MLKKEPYKQYFGIALKAMRAEDSKDVLRAIEVLHDASENDLSLDDLLLGLRSCYQEKKANSLILAVESWRTLQYDPKLVESYLDAAQKKAFAYDVATKSS